MRAAASCLAVLLLYCSFDKGVTDCTNCTEGSCEKDCGSSSEAKEVTCSTINLPTDHCDTNSGETCIDNQLPIGTKIGPLPSWIKCCNSISCPYRNTGKDIPPRIVSNTTTWTAVNSDIATLKVHWKLPGTNLVDGYKLIITIMDGYNSTVDRCMCLSANVLNYFVNVSLSAGTTLSIQIIQLPYPRGPIGRRATTNEINVTIPSSCWNTKNANYDKCGPMLPSAPRNLIVTHAPVNGSAVTMNINWDPPEVHNPNITAYKIRINDTTFVIGARRYCGTCNGNFSRPSTCQYNVTFPSAHEYVIRVSASSCQINNSTDCEHSDNITDDSNILSCWGEESTVHVVTEILPSTMPNAANGNKPQMIIVIVILSLSVLVSVMVVIVIILIITHARLRKAAADQYVPLVVDNGNFAARQAFVINSPQSSEEDLCLVRKLCHNLANNSVKPVNYEYSTFDRQHGPGQSGIYQWAEHNFTECDMTLFVCNKSFYDAWTNGDTDQNSLISASKLLLQGHLSHGGDRSRFGIILLRQCDDQYIPSLYLRSLQKFIVFQDDQCVIENLLEQVHLS